MSDCVRDPKDDPSSSPPTAFLRDGGEMGRLMRAHDWTTTVLGPPETWPQPLRTVVRLMLNTGHPMYVFWGPECACLYNDAYRQSIGPERHPGSLGRPAREVWDEIWPTIGPQIEQVMTGRGATWHVDHLVPITRHGRQEEVYWTYSYSPIDDDSAPGGIGGVLVVCTETTAQVVAGRRMKAARDLLAQCFEQAPTFMALLSGPEHRVEIANPVFEQLLGRPIVGRTMAETLPEPQAHRDLALLDEVFATGRAYAANGMRYVLGEAGEPSADERFVDIVYQPVRDAVGHVTGIFLHGVEVTDRARQEAALRDSQASFHSALRAGRLGSWETDLIAKTRQWSREGMALFGLSLPSGRGQVGGPDDEYVRALHPDDRHLVAGFRALADQEDSFPAEYRIVRPNGEVAWLTGYGLVVQRGADGRAQRLVSVMADATARRQAESALRIERERLALALSAGQMGAYDMDLETGTVWWSSKTYALFGVDAATFTPSPARIIELLQPQDREAYLRERARAIAEHRPFVHEFRVHRPDGSSVWLAQRGHAEYDTAGKALRMFGVIRDISESKEAEEMLRTADQRKDHFIATLAHELRNPLAPIRNALTILRRAPADPAQAQWCLDVLDRQAATMTRLLDDLRDVSRLLRGKLALLQQPCHLNRVVGQALSEARALTEAGHRRITLEESAQALIVVGDAPRLQHVFLTLIARAIRHTPRGGLISVTVDADDTQAIVSVADNGHGMAADAVAGVFDMFGPAAAGVSMLDGQSIGLSLVRALVLAHGGTSTAQSEGSGKGSVFEVRLPRAPAAPHDDADADGPRWDKLSS